MIPKRETDYIFDLKDEELKALWVFAKKIAQALGKAIICERVGVAVIGLEVPHAHIHLVPIHGVHDIDLASLRLRFSAEEMKTTCAKIKAQL
ncbi:MAG: HIT domain-containing protein [Owenweeksia sp.]|nr:HIT domain-containing protein [Owenweeksia sp.]